MENAFHSLLARQLKRAGIDFENSSQEIQKFITAVDGAYKSSDQDRLMLERSLELSAKELFEQNQEMRATLELVPKMLSKPGAGDERLSFSELLRKHVEDLRSSKDVLSRQADLLRNQAMELANARDEALESSRLKSAFLANMSHEIRTPINGTLGMLKVVLATDLKGDQREYLTLAEQSSLGLLSVIEDILDFSKIEAGKLDIDCVEFKPRHTLKSILATVYNQADVKGIELLADIDPNLPAKLFTDPNRLKQVFINLLTNAIKFTTEGNVLLKIKVLSRSDDNEYRILFSVRDTGIGIASDKLDRIFEAFQQADGSVTRRFGGTGLGLSISQHLVGLLGGEIKTNSIVGQGSEFYFELNIKASPVGETLILLRESTFEHASCSIITESKALSGIIRSHIKEISGDKINVSTTSVELALRDKERLGGLVFYDIGSNLNEHNKAIIEEIAKCDCKLVVIATIFNMNEREQLLSLGATAVLFKPFIDTDLAVILRQVVSRENPGSGSSVMQKARPEKITCKLRIAVVDDIHANRLVARKLLEQRGHEVVVFEGGIELLQHLRSGKKFQWKELPPSQNCDLILLDVQMPGMDGIESTQQIRKWEVEIDSSKTNHIPIVALTAHALKGDKERFIESGMDDALRKPIDSDALTSLLDRVSLGAIVEEESEVLQVETAEIPQQDIVEIPKKAETEIYVVFDKKELFYRFGNDEDIVKEIVQAFMEEEGELNLELEESFESNDEERIRKAAHALKGSLLNVAGVASAKTASALETAARDKIGGYDDFRIKLSQEMRLFKEELERTFQ